VSSSLGSSGGSTAESTITISESLRAVFGAKEAPSRKSGKGDEGRGRRRMRRHGLGHTHSKGGRYGVTPAGGGGEGLTDNLADL
jgi:hypothetical protein